MYNAIVSKNQTPTDVFTAPFNFMDARRGLYKLTKRGALVRFLAIVILAAVHYSTGLFMVFLVGAIAEFIWVAAHPHRFQAAKVISKESGVPFLRIVHATLRVLKTAQPVALGEWWVAIVYPGEGPSHLSLTREKVAMASVELDFTGHGRDPFAIAFERALPFSQVVLFGPLVVAAFQMFGIGLTEITIPQLLGISAAALLATYSFLTVLALRFQKILGPEGMARRELPMYSGYSRRNVAIIDISNFRLYTFKK